MARNIRKLVEKKRYPPGTYDPTSNPIALDMDLMISSQIGLLISCFAIIELLPPKILSRIVRMTESDAILILGHFRNFADRIAVIETVSRDKSVRIEVLLTWIRLSTKIRNEYAHGLYSQKADLHGDRYLELTSWGMDSVKPTYTGKITFPIVFQDCSILRATIVHAQEFCNSGTLPSKQPPQRLLKTSRG